MSTSSYATSIKIRELMEQYLKEKDMKSSPSRTAGHGEQGTIAPYLLSIKPCNAAQGTFEGSTPEFRREAWKTSKAADTTHETYSFDGPQSPDAFTSTKRRNSLSQTINSVTEYCDDPQSLDMPRNMFNSDGYGSKGARKEAEKYPCNDPRSLPSHATDPLADPDWTMIEDSTDEDLNRLDPDALPRAEDLEAWARRVTEADTTHCKLAGRPIETDFRPICKAPPEMEHFYRSTFNGVNYYEKAALPLSNDTH